MTYFDLAVIGGGQGGLPVVPLAACQGVQVVIFEIPEAVGACVNEGCIPTKTLLRSAEVMHLIRERAAEFGVRG